MEEGGWWWLQEGKGSTALGSLLLHRRRPSLKPRADQHRPVADVRNTTSPSDTNPPSLNVKQCKKGPHNHFGRKKGIKERRGRYDEGTILGLGYACRHL